MDITFKSLRMIFHLFFVVVVCIELTEGMGFCKFQKKFPNATNSVNEIKTTDSAPEQSPSKPTTSGQQPSSAYTDCHDVYTSGSTKDGIHQIKPINWSGSPFEVLCNMSETGGWTVFQRRMDGSVDFYRNWDNYSQGFGDLSGEFWLGNEKLYYLTNQRSYELRIDFTDNDEEFYSLEYTLFSINDESDKYRLISLGSNSGDSEFDYMMANLNQPFRTRDSNDVNHCAENRKGAWWYPDDCITTANLNGDYSGSYTTSIYVRNRDTEQYKYNIRYTEMKVRPVQ